MACFGPVPVAIALRMSTVAVRQMPSSMLSVASWMKKSLECSTKPRPVSTGPPFSTFMVSAGSGSPMCSPRLMISRCISQPRKSTLAADIILSAACGASGVRAEDASPWQRDAHSAVRLLAGSRSGAVLLGGVAIQLQQGWHTYWRTPGDSGVPPRFDFSKSDNIEAVTVLWPAPSKFDDGAGGHSMGYHDQIVLPLRIVAKNADKPVTLRADISYAVCEKICIPVDAKAELPFTSVASTEDSALFAALDT